MASRSMNYLRKNSKVILVVMGIVCMITFVVGTALLDLVNYSTASREAENAVVVTWVNGKVNQNELYRMRLHHQVAYVFLQRVVEQTLERGGQPVINGRPVTNAQQIPDVIARDSSDETLIRTMVLAEEGRRQGIVVDQDAVRAFLRQLSSPELGEGDWLQIAREVTSNRMSINELNEQLALELRAQHAAALARGGLFSHGMMPIVPPGEAWEMFNRLNRRVSIEAYPIEVEPLIAQVNSEPSVAEIEKLYQQGKYRDPDPSMNEPGFRKPLKLAFTWLKVDFTPFLDEAKKQITEEQIAEQYEKDIKEGLHKVPELPSTTPPGQPDAEKPADAEKPTDKEKPADAKPEEKADLEKSAHEPAAAGESKEGESKEPSAKPAEPKTESAKPEEPKSEGDKSADPSDDTYADEQTADEQPKSEQVADEKQAAPGPVESPQPAAKPDADQPATTDKPAQKPAEDKPAEDKPAEDKPAEDKPTDDKPASDKPADAATAPAKEPKFKPLDEVREEIRKKLAQPIANEARKKAVAEITSAIDKYGKAFRRYRDVTSVRKSADIKEPAKLDLVPLAAKYNFPIGDTGKIDGKPVAVDRHEIEKFEIGQKVQQFDMMAAQMGQFRYLSFADIAYSRDMPLYQPAEVDSSEPDISYLYFRTAEEKGGEQSLEEARPQIVAYWKKQKAFELAKADAQKLADKAAKAPALAEVVSEASKIVTTPLFSWMTTGGFGFGRPELSQVPGIELAGQEFMEGVFALGISETGIAPNQAHTRVYVVRVITQEPSDEQLRARFLESGYNQMVVTLAQNESFFTWFKWIEDVMDRYQVRWQRQPQADERI